MSKIVSPPTRFISIHNHTDRSISDAMGTVFEHMDAVHENGMDCFVNTDHGTMAAFAPAYLYMKELREKGINFKYVGGCEMYTHPDLDEWAKLREKINAEKSSEKKKKKDKTDIDTNGLVIEDEGTSRKKITNPLNRRHHLVVLPKTSKGLSNLFTLVSRGFTEGYYRFPRIDYKMLKAFGEDLIVSTACCSGPLAYEVNTMFPDVEWANLTPDLLDDPEKMKEALRRIGNVMDKLVDCVGEENVFTEIQFNAYGAQHLVNRAVLQWSKNNSFRTVATCDSHYPHRDLWRAREIYKALGWLNYKDHNPDIIPKSRDDLMCELFPKNVEQMWEAYNKYCTHEFYDDEVVKASIEIGYDIAYDMIDDIKFDESPKLPQWIVPKGKDSVHALLECCSEGLKKKGLINNTEYINRLKKEIKLIHEKKFENYFLLMNAFMKVARKSQVIGPGRGSSAGSLVNYLLSVTQIDPIVHGLIFERFLNSYRKDAPDIDCLDVNHLIVMSDRSHKKISDVVVGDMLLDHMGNPQKVKHIWPREYWPGEDIYDIVVSLDGVYGSILCVARHKFLSIDGKTVHAYDLEKHDLLHSTHGDVRVEDILINEKPDTHKFIDVEVEDSHTFQVIPFDIDIEITNNVIVSMNLLRTYVQE